MGKLLQSLFLITALVYKINKTTSQELTGAEPGLNDSTSGLKNYSHKVDIKETLNSQMLAAGEGGGTQKTPHGYSDSVSKGFHWHNKELISRLIFAQSKSFLENKEILTGIVAGGVVGGTIAVLLATLLIYKWQKKKNREHILAQKISFYYSH